ncbi:ketopantoate reductase family protein [Chloroflexota bacterium]
MRVIIYGAGAIGGVVGGHLARAGHDVLLIGRAGHVKAINENGLHLITPAGDYTLRIPAVTTPTQVSYKADDVVFLCVKGQNTEEALRDLRALTDDIPIFCFQNGVRNEEIAARYFPKVYGVVVRASSVYLADGEVIARQDPPGWLIIGRYPRGTDKLSEAVAEELRAAGFLVKVTPDIMSYKWGKLAGNITNAIRAITNAKPDNAESIISATQQEFQDILAQAGVRWVSLGELHREWPVMTQPLRGILETQSKGSTWQSLARKLGTVEVDFLNGEIVRLARKLGRQAPINEKLVQICEKMAASKETPGKYAPAELSVLLGLTSST